MGRLQERSRIITDEVRAAMKQVLAEIQSGSFAEEWMDEYHNGGKTFYATRRREHDQQIETVGKQLRGMMTFLNAKEV